MIIIGELINASRKAIKAAIEAQDAAAIQQVAPTRPRPGRTTSTSTPASSWAKSPNTSAGWSRPCSRSPTSPAPSTARTRRPSRRPLSVHQGTPMINSISLEKDRYDKLMPIIAGTDMKVIALCMSDAGMPQTVDDRMKIADELVGGLIKNNIPVENIFVDPLVQPVSVDNTFGVEFINTIEKIVAAFPGIHTACGLSNISYGLPARKFMNQTFMTMAIAKGLDGAIINPLDKTHDGQYHRRRSPGRPGQLLHELPQGLSGGDV
jgi:hypothetical protein